MQQYIIMVSKYLITLCMGFYTVESYLAFLYKREEERGAVIFRQNIWMFLLQLTAFVNLSLVTKDWNYVYLYGLVQLFLLTALVATRLIYPKCNRLLLNHMCMLLGIGMIILSRLSTFSESMVENIGGPEEIIAAIANGSGVGLNLNGLLSSKAFRQYVIIWISFLLCLLVPWILSSFQNLVKLKWLYAGAGILMLSTVLILGEVTHGSKISFI